MELGLSVIIYFAAIYVILALGIIIYNVIVTYCRESRARWNEIEAEDEINAWIERIEREQSGNHSSNANNSHNVWSIELNGISYSGRGTGGTNLPSGSGHHREPVSCGSGNDCSGRGEGHIRRDGDHRGDSGGHSSGSVGNYGGGCDYRGGDWGKGDYGGCDSSGAYSVD